MIDVFSALMWIENWKRWYESVYYQSWHDSSSAGCCKSDFGNEKNHKHMQNYFYINRQPSLFDHTAEMSLEGPSAWPVRSERASDPPRQASKFAEFGSFI